MVQEGTLTQQSEGIDRQGRGARRRWGGRKRQEGTPSDSRLGAREGVAVDRVRRGGHRRPKKKPHPVAFEARGGGWGHETKRVAGINKVSCKFHVSLFGCRVGGDVGQLEGTHEVRSPLSSLTLFLHFIFARKRYPDRAL